MTWNIQGAKSTDLDRVAAAIAEQAPDVVLLQEVRRGQADELAERLSMQHHWAEKHNPLLVIRALAEGAAILTPHRLTDTGSRVIRNAWRCSYRRRIATWGLVERSDHTAYCVINVLLSPFDRAPERLEEAQLIAGGIAELGDAPPTVVGGDFNDANEPAVVEAFDAIDAHTGAPTNPADTPTQRLDHVLVPTDATVLDVTVPDGGAEWAALSDHLPVTARFSQPWVSGDWPPPTTPA